MKVVGLGVLGFSGIVLSALSFAASDASQLDIYCSNGALEFQQSVHVGQGTRIYVNQGTYSYIPDSLPIEPSFQFIQDQLVGQGELSEECAEFLMTKGDRAFSKDGVMARVHFAFNSSELTEQSRYILDSLLERLQYANKVVVEGHTDNVGGKKYNFTLGANRAVAVSSYMAKHPNAPYNLVKISKGETDPVADNSTENGRYLNRRVDIKQ
ncbi:OmpA family protein [Marinomonas ostreistagni]|uniref:OmpA family protein n=1 Tax=Marinomonas ostreistagni TaxID=359209 RepID=A0ABS0ZCU3_9GAMM|nr:OmpA family protein [Marinomonas ostreistagni]MBJ7551488.1 OmpA family protein [Marinomonas ostreistagni]